MLDHAPAQCPCQLEPFLTVPIDSRRGEFMYPGPKRPKLVSPEGQRRIPLVIARQVDVFPAQRRQMGEISGGRMVPLLSQVIDGRCR